jgi:MOSC domain
MAIDQRPLGELEADLDRLDAAPAEAGAVELIVRRLAPGERELLATATIDAADGLVGDRWSRGKRDPEDQVMIVGARAARIFSGSEDHADWALAGDQLYVDLDLSEANLPAGTRLALGSAIIEVTAQPHAGCAKFKDRFGPDALAFVNSPIGKELHLRGINAKVVQSGRVRPGDVVRKLR